MDCSRDRVETDFWSKVSMHFSMSRSRSVQGWDLGAACCVAERFLQGLSALDGEYQWRSRCVNGEEGPSFFEEIHWALKGQRHDSERRCWE